MGVVERDPDDDFELEGDAVAVLLDDALALEEGLAVPLPLAELLLVAEAVLLPVEDAEAVLLPVAEGDAVLLPVIEMDLVGEGKLSHCSHLSSRRRVSKTALLRDAAAGLLRERRRIIQMPLK